jgi:hypothetical protein
MNNYDTILERIEQIAVTISLTSDPENIQILRRLMRMKIEEALDELKIKK